MGLRAFPLAIFAASATISDASILPRQQSNTSDASRCASFVLPSSFPESINATLNNATWYPAGTSINLTDAYSTLRTSGAKDLCRLQLDIHTFSGSQAKSEVWLPATSAWNGRFMGIGNGASAGGVEWSQLAFSAVGEGFAGHSTNAGHSSNSSAGAWALNNTGTVIDFGYRAMHQGVVVAKSIVASYYGQANFTSLYSSCSLGGRQGWMEVQRFPEDFDVLLLGSPGLDDVRQSGDALWVNQKVLPVNGSTWFSNATWTLVNQEVLRQCDALDGLVDGVLANPANCNFQANVLACRPGQQATLADGTVACLTTAQLDTLRYVYTPWVDANQTYVYAGLAYGGELGFVTGNLLPDGGQYGQDGQFFRYMVVNDSGWTVDNIDFQTVLSGVSGVGYSNSATNPDIRPFVARGGKIIQYVGWNDKYISPYASIDWVNTVDRFMTNNSNYTTSDYLRLFIVPGMGHCSGGAGPNALGQSGSYGSATEISRDPQYNMMYAALNWRENGTAPMQFIGTSFNNNNRSLGIGYQRPICQYPRWPKYSGSGNVSQASSFLCVL